MTDPDHPEARHLLVIEDDAEQARLLLRLLGSCLPADCELRLASTLGEARRALHAARYDCVLADYELPDGALDELLDAGLLPAARTIVMSGEPTAAKLRGISWFCRKPLDLGQLMPRVIELVQQPG
ncbi:MAG: hypothetical protein KDE27_29245 [Planctomycetes bacterium]|nr:hypothetical protein [Planctomycetota bacterium]